MPKKILIVEDEIYLIEMYKMKLENEGYKVFTASNGKEGLAAARKEIPDLILLDLVMPEMDGYQLLAELRKDKATKNAIIYILSNLGQSDEIKRGLEDGANGYMIKANITPAQLSEEIKLAFAGKKGEKNLK